MAKFASAVSDYTAFIRVGDLGEDWFRVGRILKMIRWRHLTVPLPRNSPVLTFGSEIQELRRWERVAREALDAEIASALTECMERLAALYAVQQSPLTKAVAENLQPEMPSRLVIASPRFIPEVTQFVRSSNRRAEVADGKTAATKGHVAVTVAVGSPQWHPGHLVTAPRSLETVFLLPTWLASGPELSGPLAAAGSTFRVRISIPARPTDASSYIDRDDPREFIPTVDWDAIKDLGLRPDRHGEDTARARLVLLAGGFGAFLEAETGSQIDTLDFSAAKGRRVHREVIARIQPGDYLVLRTEDGEDNIIRVLADALLRDRAAQLRQRQRYWKDALRASIGAKSLDEALAELQRRGLQARNLRAWLLPQTIRPSLASDFRILMEYAGIGGEAERLFKQMAQLDRAHLIAGQRLRQALEDEAEKLDANEVRRVGQATVKLGVPGTGALGIFRVEAVSPITTMIPISAMRVVRAVEDDAWLG